MAIARVLMLFMPAMALACSPAGGRGQLSAPSIPAHWVEGSDTLEPKWGSDFMFEALSFSTPTDGWIVGHRFLLHVTEAGLAVVFAEPAGVSLNSVDFRTPDDGWAIGRSLNVQRSRSRPPWEWPSPGVIWRFRAGRWEAVNLGRMSWPDWSGSVVRASSRNDIWATAFIEIPGDQDHPPAPRRLGAILMRSDGTAWEVDESPRQDGRRWNFYDICFDAAGSGWFVGADFSDSDARRVLAVRRVNDTWERSELPSLSAGNGGLTHVECLPGARAVAVGHCGSLPDQPGAPVLLRYDGVWHHIELPEAFQHADVGALAAVSDSDVWLALSNTDRRTERRPAFLHWVDGGWVEVAPPVLPAGRDYSFSDMQFVSPSEGWAIANDYGGPGIVRGLIFHYKDGVWRNRNWNWHFWDQHLFGLCGD